MRDRLIELLKEAHESWLHYVDDCAFNQTALSFTFEQMFADHLLANGVIVPPCKVGHTVYIFKGNGTIVKGIVESIHQNRIGCIRGRWIVTAWFDNYYADSKEAGFECGTHMYLTFDDFGKIVFLSREEAEAALKGVDDGKD